MQKTISAEVIPEKAGEEKQQQPPEMWACP